VRGTQSERQIGLKSQRKLAQGTLWQLEATVNAEGQKKRPTNQNDNQTGIQGNGAMP